MRSPISTGRSPNLTARQYEETTDIFFSSISTTSISLVALTRAEICAGVVPQQPPTTLTPSLTRIETSFANCFSSISKTVTPFKTAGSPAFAFIIIGNEEYLRYSRTIGASALGPCEQLTPIASAPIPSRSATIVRGSAPVISFPSSP